MTELSKIKIHYKISLVGCIKNSCGESYRLRWDMEENNGWLRTAIRLWKSPKIRPANLIPAIWLLDATATALPGDNTNWAHLRRSFQAAHSPEGPQRKMFVPNICLTMTLPRKSSQRFFDTCRQCTVADNILYSIVLARWLSTDKVIGGRGQCSGMCYLVRNWSFICPSSANKH